MDYNKRIVNEYKEKFQHLVEYTNAGSAFKVNEDGEDPNMMGADPSMGGAPMGDPSMGGAPGMDAGMGADPSMGADPNMGGAPMGDPNAMGGDPNMMGADANMGGGVEGFNPQGAGSSMGTDPNMEGEEEEVIDVDELVNKQDETAEKIDKLASSFDKLVDTMKSFKDMVDSSNERMESLKAEIERRNPTPVEKLSLRSGNGYPFNQTPDEYWQTKQATSNYSTEDDNNGADDPQYQITKDEIDNFNDYASVAKDLTNDFNLRDMFGY
jgi:hypothetical protein